MDPHTTATHTSSEAGGSSTQTTLNRGKNRLGLLLKQYYEDPAMGSSGDSVQFSLPKLQKLKTEPLMARSVESLRSYKEAESELRMLLYNNCDKLLEAVKVVVTIREGSGSIVKEAADLGSVADSLDTLKNPVMAEYRKALAAQSQISALERIIGLPAVLSDNAKNIDDRIKLYLKVAEEFFSKTSGKFPLVAKVASKCKTIVEDELVPILMNELVANSGDSKTSVPDLSVNRATRMNLLLDLFPSGHPRHGEMIYQFIQFEVIRFDQLLQRRTSAVVSKTDALNTFNGLITTLFLAQDLEPTSPGANAVVEKIRDTLLPRASAQMLTALLHGSADNIEYIQDAILAHMRIPNVSRGAILEFRRQAVVNHLEARFVDAARTCISEDLVSLLASSAFGACCDVIHTRCCAVLVDAEQFLGTAEFVEDPSDFVTDVTRLLREYYSQVTMPSMLLARELKSSEKFDLLVRLLKMNKFIHNRKTLDRSMNSMSEIFNVDPQSHVETESVVPISTYRLVKLVGLWTEGYMAAWTTAIEQGLCNVLDSASATAGARRFSTTLNELDGTELVHSRKIIFPADSQVESKTMTVLPSLELGICVVTCLFLKSVREKSRASGAPPIDVSGVSRLVEKYLTQSSEFYQTINAMIRDITIN